MGNSSYPDDPLENPAKDAADMAQALRELEFGVDLHLDLGRREMQAAIGAFQEKITLGSVALVYFAGHGTQIDRSNHLIPLGPSSDFEQQAIPLTSVLDTLDASRSWLNIVILDVCRDRADNEDVAQQRGRHISFSAPRAISRGFAVEPASPAAGTFIAYATAPGQLADDGPPGRNGVFTGALLTELRKPGVEIEELFRNTAKIVTSGTDGRQLPWRSSSLTEPIVLHRKNPSSCLDRLASIDRAGVSSRLGRVFWNQEITEPVLIRADGAGDEARYSFRHCTAGRPADVAIEKADMDIYDSALVARFQQPKTEALETFRETGGLGYAPEGTARLIFRGAGAMLEARRIRDSHLEIMGTGSVNILREWVPVLLVSTRAAMNKMDLKIWDEPWGDHREDSGIGREIVWWELEGSDRLRLHPPVDTFEALADRIAEPGASSWLSWSEGLADDALAEQAQALLGRAAFSLIVADGPEHTTLAANILARARMVNSADLDVANLEPSKEDKGRWTEEDLKLLEETADRGRYWPLSRFYDLAAIMPNRIAGKIRYIYRKSMRKTFGGSGETRFQKEHVILSAGSTAFQLGNAIFEDQAAGMDETLSFLGCLFEESYNASDRVDTLRQGLERTGIPLGELKEAMDVSEVFQYLFHGLSLPPGLRVGELLFLGRVRQGDPELLGLIRSLQGYLGTAVLQPDTSCETAFIPDVALLGQATEGLKLIPPIPKLDEGSEPPVNKLYADALAAKEDARDILEKAIYVKGARHTRRKITKGHKRRDQGNRLLKLSNGVDVTALEDAIVAFVRAQEIFSEAKKTAYRKEHSKPTVRVH